MTRKLPIAIYLNNQPRKWRFTTTPRELFLLQTPCLPILGSSAPGFSPQFTSLKRYSHLVHDCIARERPQNHLQNSSSRSLFCHAQQELVINRSDQNHSLLVSLAFTFHANHSWTPAGPTIMSRRGSAQPSSGRIGRKDCDGMPCIPYIMPLKYHTTENLRLLKII